MEHTGSNYFLIILIVFISLYVLLTVHRTAIDENILPLSILMISLSLILVQSLATNYVTPGDFYSEYEGFKVTSNFFIWDLSIYSNQMVACLSTSLLPTVFLSLMGTSDLFVAKVVYPVICSLIPVICYMIYINFIPSRISFMSSFFFLSQLFFLFSMKEQLRFIISLFFMSIFFYVLLNNDLHEWKKRSLLIIFTISIVTSYYSLPLIFIYVLVCLYILPRLNNRLNSFNSYINISMVLLSIIFLFAWWGMLTVPKFDSYIYIIQKTFLNIGNFFVLDMRSPTIVHMTKPMENSIPDLLTISLHYFEFLLIGIYVLINTGMLLLLNQTKKLYYFPFSKQYIIIMFSMFSLAFLFILLPYISVAYGTFRLYQTTLVILSPAMVMGFLFVFDFICRLFRKSDKKDEKRLYYRFNVFILSIILVLQLFSATGLLNQIYSDPFSEYLNEFGIRHDVLWVYDSEIIAAKWLYDHTYSDFYVATDWGSPPATIFGFATKDLVERVKWDWGLYSKKKNYTNTYIYLRRANIERKLLYSNGINGQPLNLSDYVTLLNNKNRIFAGNSVIYS